LTQSNIKWPWFLYARYRIWGNVLGAPSVPAAAASRANGGSVKSSSGFRSIRRNSVSLSVYLKISELKSFVYASAAWG
jgi:hypothetical protein